MTALDWGAIAQAAADIRANKAPPTLAGIDAPNLAATFDHLQAVLPEWIAALKAHQGVLTGLGDVLAAMSKAGVPHAAEIETAVVALPGALETADRWLPWILPFLGGGADGPFGAAATGIPGGFPGARGHV